MAKLKSAPKYDTSITAADIISKALEIFGPDGEHWTTGALHKKVDGNDSYCMLGGLNKARAELKAMPAENTKAKKLLAEKINPAHCSYAASAIIGFNDRKCAYGLYNDRSKKEGFKKVKNAMCSVLKQELADKEAD